MSESIFTTRESKVLSLAQAAEFLGLSKSHMYKLTMTHALPFYKPTGGKCYFLEQDLVSWIKGSPIATRDEVAAIVDNHIRKGGAR